MSKFNIGDIVYLNKRGVMKGEATDWTIIPDCLGNILNKNQKYIIRSIYTTNLSFNGKTETKRIMLKDYSFGYSIEHFIKYEEV